MSKYGISAKVDLPAVGENLQDQPNVAFAYQANTTYNGTTGYVTFGSITDFLGLITEDDLILVTDDGQVVDGGQNRFLNYAACATHSEIHAARSDVVGAAHSHIVNGRAFCATGRTLEPITQDPCVFYDDHVLCPYESSHRSMLSILTKVQNVR
jgi:ribulose-5-phosphate 4-epimerase/fuculose-1-phosphate aldolase